MSAARPSCPRCRWPLGRCFCSQITPASSDLAVTILMHPKEARRQRSGTGRLCALALDKGKVVEVPVWPPAADGPLAPPVPGRVDVLLWPGPDSLEPADWLAAGRPEPQELRVLVLDATWSCARSMLRDSDWLRDLPRLTLPAGGPSAWRFKKQPRPECLSTIEAVTRLLAAFAALGVERFADTERLLGLFEQLQEAQTAYEDHILRGM